MSAGPQTIARSNSDHYGGRSAVVSGCGAWLPTRVIHNGELAERFGVSCEWILSRTGIRSGRVVEPGVTLADLAVEAGSLALKSAGVGHVDAVVLATTTPGQTCPGAAPEVADRLGMGTVAAFGLAAASSGFVYGMAVSAGLINSGVLKRVLLVSAEVLSPCVDPDDRSTAVLFGDGAGAVVLSAGRPGDLGAVGPFDLGSDGARADLLVMPSATSGASLPYLRMKGPQVYRQAVARVTESAGRVLDRAGWSVDDVDHLMCHQANGRIQDAVVARLGIAPGRCRSNLEHIGNTQAASLPLLLAHTAVEGRLAAGDRILLTSFGAGLSWGSTVLTWPGLTACTN
ncbi:beta-ketoacyl-ACP synthase III [Streptomyces sp. NPDC055239]